MKRIKKSKLIISIILLSLLIIEIITIGLSRASKTIDITLTAIDASSTIGKKELTIEASKTDDGNYSLTFPKEINGFQVSSYSLQREYATFEVDEEAVNKKLEAANISLAEIDTESVKIGYPEEEEDEEEGNQTNDTIESNEAIVDNGVEETNEIVEKSESQLFYENLVAEHTKEIISTQAESYVPGTTVNLTNVERKYKKITATVTYDTNRQLDITYYKQTLKANTVYDSKASTVEVTGYFPLNSKLVLNSISNDQKANIENSILDNQPDDKFRFYDVYSPKILYSTDSNALDMNTVNDSNLEIFNTTLSGSNITFKLSNLNNKGYYVLNSVNENTEDYDFAEIAKVEGEDSIEYTNTTLGKYALLYDPSYSLQAVEDGTTIEQNVLKAASTDTSTVVWDGTISTGFLQLDSTGASGAAGTLNNPYLIASGADLAYLAQRVNNGTTFNGSYFRLLVNIDLDGKKDGINNREWTPIGSGNHPFQGRFDGQGHTIANGLVNSPNALPGNNVYIYLGLFGAVGGANANSSDNTYIRNLEIKAFNVNIVANGNLEALRGYYIGTITGALFRSASIENCVIANSTISLGTKPNNNRGKLIIREQRSRIFVGGAIGGIQQNYNTYGDSGNSRPRVRAVFSEVNIIADNATTYRNGYRHYNALNFSIGGIVGATVVEKTVPNYCAYTGNIRTSEGFTGPIMGGAYTNAQANNTTNLTNNNYANTFETIFRLSELRNNADADFKTNYYYSYSITTNTVNNGNGDTYDFDSTRDTIKNENVENSYDYRIYIGNTNNINNTSYNGKFLGMNGGVYKSSNNDIYNALHDNVFYENNTPSINFTEWEDTGNSFNLITFLAVNINANGGTADSYIAVPDPYAPQLTYSYYWYIDGVRQNIALTNNIINNVAHSWTAEKVLTVFCVNQDGHIAFDTKEIERYELHIVITESGGVFNSSIQGTGTNDPNFNLANYTYQWYYIDIADGEEILDGETGTSLSNLVSGHEYEIRATNSIYQYMNATGSRIYGNRNVIYVNSGTYNIGGTDYSGNDANDGFTPQTAVRTIAVAYGKLYTSYTRDENIIVIMGVYNANNNHFTDNSYSTSTTYAKEATLTGKYRGTSYGGQITISNAKYLKANTTFMHLQLNGGGGTNYDRGIYTEGYSLTMGKGLTMSGFGDFGTSQGCMTTQTGTIGGFQLCGPYTPRAGLLNNRPTSCEIVVLSGTYSRFIVSGRQIYSSGNHYYALGSETRPYNCKVTIDIQDGVGNGRYDINVLVAGKNYGSVYGNVEINLINGKVARFIGGNLGREATTANDLDPRNGYFGSTTINMSGGSTEELFCAGYGRNSSYDVFYYGTIELNLTGGRIIHNTYNQNNGTIANRHELSGSVYGGGAGGVTGYKEGGYGTGNANKPFNTNNDIGEDYPTSISIYIGGNVQIDGDVFGGGYGYSPLLSSTHDILGRTYCDTSIVIEGGTIGGSVYGAGKGHYHSNAYGNVAQMTGDTSIIVKGGTIEGNIYGAGLGINNRPTIAKLFGNTTVDISIDSATFANEIYGGSSFADVDGTTTVNLNSGTLSGNIYGGCNSAGVTESATVNLKGATSSKSIFGGSNTSGVVANTHVNMTSGEAFKVYGGNNAGGTTKIANVTMNGAKIKDAEGTENDGAIYGGGLQATTNRTNVVITSNVDTIPTVFGGGERAGVVAANDVTNSGQTFVSVAGTKINDLYGGSNQQGDITTSNITINGGTITNIYGANNKGGTTRETKININGGTITNTFGGGNEANTNITNITTNGGTITNVYGGGNEAGVITQNGINGSGNTHVNLLKGNITNAFGGSNSSGNVPNTNVIVGANNSTNTGLNVTSVYGGNNVGGNSSTTHVTTYQTTIRDIFGGSKGAGATAGNTNVTINHTHVTESAFGGGDEAPTTNTTNISLLNSAIIDKNVYGGGNEATIGSTNNNGSTHLSITNSTIKGNAFAAGNGATAIVTGTTYAEILTGAVIGVDYDETYHSGCIYGGGNEANVVGNTEVLFNGGTVKTHVFGGGNEGIVTGSTIVNAKTGTIDGSIYGGGNLATVEKNTLVNVYGTIKVGSSTSEPPEQGSVFAGGNHAETGLQTEGGSKNILNIAGGEIFGNAYGGANTSKVWGSTIVNIGLKAIQDYKAAHSNIYNIPQDMTATALTIHGTVFGGGESNASGSELYDWSYISATEGIDVNIDGQGYQTIGIRFEKSVFGSGNASSSSGTSTIDIYNLGTYQVPNGCVSIQRTDILTIKNSALALEGINDSTNDHANELYTLNYIGDLKLANGSTLYLKNTSNCLSKWESLSIDSAGNETAASINIDANGNGTPNVRNNLYMLEGKQLLVRPPKDNTEEQYGKVIGMTFLGIFNNIDSPYASIGTYYKDTATNGQNIGYQAFNFTSVLGKHMKRTSNDPEAFLLNDGEHDITKAGFYSNKYVQDGVTDEELEEMINENQIRVGDPGKLKTYYVGVQPPGAAYYIWNVGNVDMTTYYLNIEASKYDTLGTKELSLTGFAVANTFYQYGGCRFNLNSGVTIKPESEIPKIANPKADADYNFGLAMKTGAYGWVRSGSIEFVGSGTEGNMIEGGDQDFKTENSAAGTEDVTPDLEFYFYHSQNIQTNGPLGNVKIYLNVEEPIPDSDGKNYRKICVDITLTRKLYADEFVEQSIQPGKKYDIFTSTKTQIVSDGVFSTYDTIYIDHVSQKERSEQYKHSRRVLVSTDFEGDPYYFNAGTKITMLDLVSNQTYYYIVTPEDATGPNRTYKYYFSKFKKMGSMDEPYNETDALNNYYYNSTSDELYERYIFHYDFAEANVGQNVLNKIVSLELEATVDNEDRTIIELIGSQREDVLYSLYTNSDAVIDVIGTLSTNPLYVGKANENITVETLLTQSASLDGKRIYDTNFFEDQMGIKISLIDSNGIQQDSDAMLGIYFTVDGDLDDSNQLIRYYPRLDGSTRIKIGTKVANSIAKLVMHTEENQSLATGDYSLKIETYGSSDGYYYGDQSSRSTEKPLTIISGIFGLKVTSPVNQKIFKSNTGLNVDKNNQLDLQVQYSSLLDNPVLTVSCERRDYSGIYSKTYEAVDLAQIVSDGPTEEFDETTFTSNYMYRVAGKTELGNSATKSFNYKMKTKVPTGTYKIVYSIYDGTTYIGSAYEYFIVN